MRIAIRRRLGIVGLRQLRRIALLLGRWRRLSAWRKTLAVGAFAVGTFGLGFTLGGLIFGRWRRA